EVAEVISLEQLLRLRRHTREMARSALLDTDFSLRAKRGSVLRAWRLDLDIKGTGLVDEADFNRLCVIVGHGDHMRAIWDAMRPGMFAVNRPRGARVPPLALCELDPELAATAQQFAEALLARAAFNLDDAWGMLARHDSVRGSVPDEVTPGQFERCAECLGQPAAAEPLFGGLAIGQGRVWREDFEYLWLLAFHRTLPGPGRAEGGARARLRREPRGGERFRRGRRRGRLRGRAGPRDRGGPGEGHEGVEGQGYAEAGDVGLPRGRKKSCAAAAARPAAVEARAVKRLAGWRRRQRARERVGFLDHGPNGCQPADRLVPQEAGGPSEHQCCASALHAGRQAARQRGPLQGAHLLQAREGLRDAWLRLLLRPEVVVRPPQEAQQAQAGHHHAPPPRQQERHVAGRAAEDRPPSSASSEDGSRTRRRSAPLPTSPDAI
ncbi:unnamed protein product, partial [Prorocentrum cordatum]